MAYSDPNGSDLAWSPAQDYAAVTTSDTTNLFKNAVGIYVGVAGDVVCVTPAGTAITFKNAAAGTILPVMTKRVNATNTTATNLVALYN